MNKTLMQRRYRVLTCLIIVYLSAYAGNLFAGNLRSSVVVGCTVINNKTTPLKILEMPGTSIPGAANLLRNVKVSCPTGTAVTMSVQTQTSPNSSDAQATICPLPTGKSDQDTPQATICPVTPHSHFYKDALCTIVWKLGEEQIINPATQHGASAPAIYSQICKKNPGTVSLKEDESITILTITLEY